jgi:hypothetical protein
MQPPVPERAIRTHIEPRRLLARQLVRRRSKVVPTEFWMKESGRRAARACVAFQPVQWVGTITSGARSASASQVGPMRGSNKGPLRQLTGLPASVAQQTITITQVHYVPLDSSVVSSEQAIADAFASQGLIPHVDFGSVVDTRCNDLIRRAA